MLYLVKRKEKFMRDEELIIVLNRMEDNLKYSKILQRWIHIKNKF